MIYPYNYIAEWIIPAISAGASLLGGLFNSKSNKKAVEDTNQQQIELAKMQHEWNVSDYQQQLADQDLRTDPQYIMTRLRSAGLNPEAYFNGGVASASMSSTSQPNLQAYQGNNFVADAVNNALTGMSTVADYKFKENESTIAKSQDAIAKMLSENTIKDSSARRRIEERQAIVAEYQSEANIKKIEAEIHEINSTTIGQRLNNELTAKYGDKMRSAEIRQLVQSVTASEQSIRQRWHELELDGKRYNLSAEEMSRRKQNIVADTVLKQIQAEHLGQKGNDSDDNSKFAMGLVNTISNIVTAVLTIP